MNDDRIERLLRGYALPGAPPSLDRRVMDEAGRMLARARFRATFTGITRQVVDSLGFGYVNYFVDLVTVNDAEYRVDLI